MLMVDGVSSQFYHPQVFVCVYMRDRQINKHANIDRVREGKRVKATERERGRESCRARKNVNETDTHRGKE